VSVTARVGRGTATVTVRFSSAATEATVEVRGVDGLAVTSDPTRYRAVALPRRGRDLRRRLHGGPRSLAPGGERVGDFGGAKRSMVASFAVGTPTPDQLKPVGTSTTDSAGQRIKVMPVDGK